MSSTIKTWEDRAIITATGVVTVRDAMQAEIDELRAALQAQPVQEPINNRLADDIAAIDLRHRGFPSYEHDGFYVRSAAEKMIRNGYALYAAPTQPVQERALPSGCGWNGCGKTDAGGVVHDCAYPDCVQPVQEPVAWRWRIGESSWMLEDVKPLQRDGVEIQELVRLMQPV